MLTIAGIIVVAAPLLLLAVFGIATLLRISLTERNMARFTEASTVLGLISALFILAVMLATNERNVSVVLGDWVRISGSHAHDLSGHEEKPEHEAAKEAAENEAAEQLEETTTTPAPEFTKPASTMGKNMLPLVIGGAAILYFVTRKK